MDINVESFLGTALYDKTCQQMYCIRACLEKESILTFSINRILDERGEQDLGGMQDPTGFKVKYFDDIFFILTIPTG